MGRILGIDYGEKRIGLALSDQEQKFSFEYEIWQAQDFFKNIAALIADKEVEKIVLGYPLNMQAEKTKKTEEVLEFKNKLEKTVSLPVELVDERLSSQMAAKISGSQKGIDALAAQILLQNYINKNEKNEHQKTS